MTNRLIRIAIAALFGLVIAYGAAWWLYGRPQPGAGGTVTATQVGGPFSLTDHTGRAVTEKDFAGRLLLVYFGYTTCPDVCPTELGAMAAALEALGPAAEKVQPLFVTVDPARDTPEHLKEYVGLFHPRLVGLTGTPEQTAAAAKAYKVYYAKRDSKDGSPYLMDHSGFVYVMGPDGYLLDVLPGGVTPDKIAETLRNRLSATS